MIQIAYLGKGGRYATYLQESIRRIRRHRAAEIVGMPPTLHDARRGRSGAGQRTVVAIHHSGMPLTTRGLQEILQSENVVFVVGDATGIPQEVLRQAGSVVSVSSLPVDHGMEAAIVASQVERAISGVLAAD